MLLYTNMNKDKTTDSVNEGRYERIRHADIKKHGYTELAGRNDPKRAHVVKANTRKIARDRRLAGIVPGSANARPENRSDALIHSARKSAAKRVVGKPSPRIAPKNRDRTIADSFNHGLEEGHKRNHRLTQSKSAPLEVVQAALKGVFRRQEAQDNGVRNTRERLRRIRRNLTNSFNHGLDEAKRPPTPKRPIKQSKNIFGAAARGAVSGLTTSKPAGTSRTRHVLGQAVRNMARHVMDKFL